MGSPGARKATTVTIRFLDDEIMEGRVANISLNQPNIEVQMPDEASNNERALIPFPSIKRITLTAGEPSSEERARAGRKVAIRFQDGEVLKGYLDGELHHASHGLTLRLLSVEKDRIETLGIPYTALKALFYLKTWATRAEPWSWATGRARPTSRRSSTKRSPPPRSMPCSMPAWCGLTPICNRSRTSPSAYRRSRTAT